MPGRHYLDHASTSPLRREAASAIAAWTAGQAQADPGRPYEEGRLVRDELERAREQVAELLGIRPRELIFTSGGTEAANWASQAARAGAGPEAPVLLAGVEHSAVRRSAERYGPVRLLPVDQLGRVDLDALADALRAGPRPCLVHCQFGNHEVGTLQPLAEVASLCADSGVPLHTDACSAVGQLPIDCADLGAALISVSAHKLGGPPGIGALVVRRGTRLAPLLLGGEQERGRRAGMENVPGILGFGAAAAVLSAPGALEQHADRARRSTELLLEAACQVSGVIRYGATDQRLPHLVCLGVPDLEAEGVVLGLDRAGIAVHSGSACASEGFEPSPVLEAMGVEAERSLRLSVGWSTEAADLLAFSEAFPRVVADLRALRS